MSLATDFLLDIAMEKNGYSIGKPWRFSEFSLVAIVPITRATDAERAYRLASEMGDALKIRDTGVIDKVEIDNGSNYPVLLKAGELISGATQTRTLASSQVLMPEERVIADCICVHSSRGIRPGEPFGMHGFSPGSVKRQVYDGYQASPSTPDVTPRSDFVYTPSLQRDVWSSVRDHSSSLQGAIASHLTMAHSGRLRDRSSDDVGARTTAWSTPSDDLAGRVWESGEKLADVLRRMPKTENQAGICFLTLNGVQSLESFENPASWEALREGILKSESAKVADVSDQDGVFEFKAVTARAAIRKLLTTRFEEAITIDKLDTSTLLLKSETPGGFIGEVVTLYGQPIHCCFIKGA